MQRIRNLENQIAIVTGSSKGIGRAIALEFAGNGASVVVCGRDAARVDEVFAEVEARGAAAHSWVGGLSTKADCDALVSSALERFGRVDILVNNAGGVQMAPFLDFPAELWQEHFDIHVNAAMYCSQAAARAMKQQGYGRIVVISSIAAGMANPGLIAYGPAKAAIEGLTRMMAVELAPFGIAVNAVAPGPVANEMMQQLLGEEKLRERALTIPMGRLATAEDVAHAVLFFALPASGYITGQVLGVDGGAKAAGAYTANIYQQRKAGQG